MSPISGMLSVKHGDSGVVDALEELKKLRDAILRSIEGIADVPASGSTAREIERRMKILKEIDADIRKFEAELNADRS